MLPSSFTNMIEESKKLELEEELVSMKLPSSVTITPVPTSLTLSHKTNGTHNGIHNSKEDSEDQQWDITKHLPAALLEECTVEISNSPNVTKSPTVEDFNSEDAIEIITKPAKKIRKKVHNLEDGYDIRDIINRVEVVYSDDEMTGENYSNENMTNGNKVNGSLVINGDKGNNGTIQQTYSCDHCPNKYNNRGALWQHSVASHSVEKTCECQLCGRKFYRNCSLALHMKCHSDEQNCCCNICGKKFNRLSLLEKHSKIHVETVFTCRICNKRFPDQLTLQKHIVTHNEKYSCDLCNVTFHRKQLLALHFEITHNRSETPFICRLCKARFSNLKELSEHSLTHTSEMLQLTCQYCGETFTQRSVFKKHVHAHKGERLRCEVCRIDFTQRSSLLRHLKRLHGIGIGQNVDPRTSGNDNSA